VWLSLGLFWRTPRRPHADVLAVTDCWFDGGGGPAPRVDLPSRDSRVAIGPVYKRSERRLILEPREDFDPVEAFGLLLDSMDDALSTVESVSGTSVADQQDRAARPGLRLPSQVPDCARCALRRRVM